MPSPSLLARRAPRRLVADDGVSPVVGMILVLGISVVGIAAVVYWGLPAIDEMKANVEFRSVESQFHDLDSTVKELAAGTTQRTAKRWMPSISRGEIYSDSNSEPWLMAVEHHNSTGIPHDFVWAGFTDDDNRFTVRNIGKDALHVKVEAYAVSGTSLTPVNVSLSSSTPAQMTTASLPTWANNTNQEFYLWVKDAATPTQKNLDQGTFAIRVYTGQTLVAEAWFSKVGRIVYNLDAGLGNKLVASSNGAILTGNHGSQAIVNAPSLPPPTLTAGKDRFFGRLFVLEGDVSFAGQDRFDALLSLYATVSLASYDCVAVDQLDCIQNAKIFVYGKHQAPWYAYLSNTNRGYGYEVDTVTVGTESVSYLRDARSAAAYTLIQSVITVG